MLVPAAAAAFLLAAQAAPNPPIGQRTVPPSQTLGDLGAANVEAEIAAQAAAAAAHPLGTLDNPVRVGGPDGERAYLARLRCANGAVPAIGPRREGGVGAYGSIVAAFPLDCGNAAPGRFTIVLDMYHAEHRETAAPAGFTILP